MKRSPIRRQSTKRATQNRQYIAGATEFLYDHPVCPVTGERTNQIHHSAKREGQWLNLQRYWIAVSGEGHRIIEDNGKWAASHGLTVRINKPYKDHVADLVNQNIDIHEPIFYQNWDGEQIKLDFHQT